MSETTVKTRKPRRNKSRRKPRRTLFSKALDKITGKKSVEKPPIKKPAYRKATPKPAEKPIEGEKPAYKKVTPKTPAEKPVNGKRMAHRWNRGGKCKDCGTLLDVGVACIKCQSTKDVGDAPKEVLVPLKDVITPPVMVVPPPPPLPTDPLLKQYQLSHQTKANRFPKIFNSALKFKPNPTRILSFGCSTGEECFTLADLYPNAEILGVDLDKYSIGQAKKENKFKGRVGFVDNLEEAGKFDIIFCLMVLFSIHNPVSYENFSDTIEKISSHLNYRGLLVMYTGQHDIMSTSSGKKYAVIRQWTRQHSNDKRSYFNGYFRKKRH